MTQSNSNSLNHCLDVRDPAMPGDPWSRLRYQYGQLLGAEDFEQEQTYFVLRRRLHNALLHGFGTAWGLRVKTSPTNASQLLINHGLGFDVLGRAIHVDKNEVTPCLDVSRLHDNHKFWSAMDDCIENDQTNPPSCPAIGEIEEKCAEPDVEEETKEERPVADACNKKEEEEKQPDGDQPECSRYAYIVISYRAGQSHKVPAITPSCDISSDEALVFSRITDQYFAEILPQPPECDTDLFKNWLDNEKESDNNKHCWNTLHDRLVDHIINDNNDIPLEKLWNKNTKASLLLARITLTNIKGITQVSDINNKVRPLLPSVQLIGEQLLGQKLNGQDNRKPLKLLSVEQVELEQKADIDKKQESNNKKNNKGKKETKPSYKFKFIFSRPLSENTFNTETVKVYRLRDGAWGGCLDTTTEADCTSATISINNCIESECVTLQFHLAGSDHKPIVSQAGMPLDGWWDQPVSAVGRGCDISLVRTWEKNISGGNRDD